MNNSYLHYRYVILMLGLALVCTFAYFYCGDDELVKVISFAGTLISIVLSLLAIFITVLSNDSMSSMIHKIRDLYEVIKDMPSSIDTSISSLSESTGQLQDNMQKLNALLPELKAEINYVDQHIRESNEAIKALSGQQLDGSKVSEGVSTINVDDLFKYFLQTSSFIGLCLLYLLKVASENNKTISLAEYSKTVDAASTLQYDFGFYIACRAFGILACTISNDDMYVISNIVIHPKLKKENIVEALKTSAHLLHSSLFTAEDYMAKIDKFVKEESK